MQVFFGIAYVVIGLVQLFAIMDGLAFALGINQFFAVILSLFITYIPLVGSVAGIYGAVKVWDWSLLQAGALFFWYVPVFIAMMIFVGAESVFSRR